MAGGAHKKGVVLRNTAVAATLVILVNLLFGGTVLKGQRDEHALLMERAERARAELLRPRTGEAVKAALADVETFNAMLPGQGQLTRVITDIHRVARRNGLNVPSSDYGQKTVREAGISRYTISFPVEGTYKKIKKFIYDMEVLEHVLAVEAIAFSSSKGGGAIGLNLTISTYFR